VLKVNCVGSPALSRTRYFVGDFDGRAFRRDPTLPALIPECGDAYAEVTYNDVPDGRRILIGWIRQQPSASRVWTGIQSIPRVLSLRTTPAGIKLCQAPVAEIATLRREKQTSERPLTVIDRAPFYTCVEQDGALEIEAEFDLGAAVEAGICLNMGGSNVRIGYARTTAALFVDRPGSERLSLPLALQDACLKLHILLDRSVVEVFGGMGEATISAVLEPNCICTDVELFSRGGAATLIHADTWTLASAW
jgi:sucrose-6-phosphate hydrolase SacC (GH32 family)